MRVLLRLSRFLRTQCCLSMGVARGAESRRSSCLSLSGWMTVGSASRFDAGPGSTDATGKRRNALTNQREVVQVHLLPMSGCSLTAKESSSPAVRVLIGQMPGPRTFIGAKGMQQENRSSRPLLVTRLCSGRSYAPLRGSRASSSSTDSGSGSARNSKT